MSDEPKPIHSVGIEPSAAPLAWSRITSYFHAVATAGVLEVRCFTGRRGLAAALHAVNESRRGYGKAAIEGALTLDDEVSEAMRMQGIAYANAVSEVAAWIARRHEALRAVDPKSPAARQCTVEILQAESDLKQRQLELTRAEACIGDAVRIQYADRAGLKQLQATYDQAMTSWQTAYIDGQKLDQQRDVAYGRLGVPLRFQAISALVVLVAICLMMRISTHRPNGMVGPGTTATSSLALQASKTTTSGLTREQLKLASVLVETQWSVWRPGSNGLFGWTPMADETGGCTGSASVFAVGEGGKVGLMTNRHVLGLADIMGAKANGDLAIKDYRITVKFPSGKRCPVVKIGHIEGDLDIAVLGIEDSGLRPGVDYTLLGEPPASVTPQVGDNVVAIGNPGVDGMVYENTQTFGRISGFRDQAMAGESTNTRYIQTDVAINHGNSGGPLFVQSGERYYWIGVNTLGIGRDQGYQGLNFAIDARQASHANGRFYDASVEGTAKALSEFYDFSTGVYH